MVNVYALNKVAKDDAFLISLLGQQEITEWSSFTCMVLILITAFIVMLAAAVVLGIPRMPLGW